MQVFDKFRNFYVTPKFGYVVIFFVLLMFMLQNCFALAPENHLPEFQEQRARELFLQINCPICSGQVIESSNTEVAFQLRKLVRQQISQGKNNEEIKFYLKEKYGDNILNSPSFNGDGVLLWILPIMFIIFGVYMFLSNYWITPRIK